MLTGNHSGRHAVAPLDRHSRHAPSDHFVFPRRLLPVFVDYKATVESAPKGFRVPASAQLWESAGTRDALGIDVCARSDDDLRRTRVVDARRVGEARKDLPTYRRAETAGRGLPA